MKKLFYICVLALSLLFSCCNQSKEAQLQLQQQKKDSIQAKTDSVRKKIGLASYYHYKNNLESKISFNFFGMEKNKGLMYLRQDNCKYTYKIEISGTTIQVAYETSDCGRTLEVSEIMFDISRNEFCTEVDNQTFCYSRKARINLERDINGRPETITPSDSQYESNIPSNPKYVNGADGRMYETQPCSLCNGTGIERSTSSMSNDRICPQCNGTGHQSY
jgi:hypothetical protein